MKQIFRHYYRPSDAEVTSLWRNGLFVLDTNILLLPYRVSRRLREELLNMFEQNQHRFWVPFQVGLEFQHNRISRRREHIKTADKIKSNLQGLLESILSPRFGPQEGSDEGRLIKEAISHLEGLIGDLTTDFGDSPQRDTIFEKITEIFSGKVGEPPNSDDEYRELLEDCRERYEKKVPPGYEDREKEKRGEVRQHGGREYRSEHGDLIIWRQIIKKCKDDKVGQLAFVTNDAKEDWLWRVDGQIIGPRPELREEIERLAGVETFWIYSLERFLDRARREWGLVISSEEIARIIEASADDGADYRDWYAARSLPAWALVPLIDWLRARYGEFDNVRQGRVGPYVHFLVAGQTAIIVVPVSEGASVDSEVIMSQMHAASYLLSDRPYSGLIYIFCCEKREAAEKLALEIPFCRENYIDLHQGVIGRIHMIVGHVVEGEFVITADVPPKGNVPN